MPEYDAGFKIVARTVGRQLAELAGVVCQQWTPLVSEVQTTERLADRVFRARRGRERFVVYMEAYTRWDRAAPWNVLAKSGLLSERERLPTLSLVYILLPRGYRPQQGQFRLAVGHEATQQVWFREIRLWEQVPRASWEQTPGLMALYPLCRHQRRAREAVAYPAGVIKEGVVDANVRADLLATLGFFGKLVYPGMDVVQLIGREQMRESKFFQEVMELGRVENQRANILKVLSIRFGPEKANEFTTSVNALEDLEQLSRLHELAVRCSRLDEFRKGFVRN